jgi:hypothetical protein
VPRETGAPRQRDTGDRSPLVYSITDTRAHLRARAGVLLSARSSGRKLSVDRLLGVLCTQLPDHFVSILGRAVTHYQCKSRKSVSQFG